MEDAVLFMVRYLQEVQGPKHVVGRDFAYIAATPEARRLFLSTARHLMLQVGRPVARSCQPSVLNHDGLKLTPSIMLLEACHVLQCCSSLQRGARVAADSPAPCHTRS
jgi:hypothetical protein